MPSYACGYNYASVDSYFTAATSVQHPRCSPARSRDLHGSYFAAATSVRPLRGSAALSLEPDCSYIAVPLAEPVAMPPAAPPATATALQRHQCTAGADWPGLMIFINMTFSSMTFVIMLRWLKPPTATAAAATHCSGDRRPLHHDPRHSRDRLGRIDDLHHHDLRHHDAVADGDMLRWLQLASSLDLNCSDCHYSLEQWISYQCTRTSVSRGSLQPFNPAFFRRAGSVVGILSAAFFGY